MKSESLIIQDAYVTLLMLPLESVSRLHLQTALANMRDELARITEIDAEEIQRICETLAKHRALSVLA